MLFTCPRRQWHTAAWFFLDCHPECCASPLQGAASFRKSCDRPLTAILLVRSRAGSRLNSRSYVAQCHRSSWGALYSIKRLQRWVTDCSERHVTPKRYSTFLNRHWCTFAGCGWVWSLKQWVTYLKDSGAFLSRRCIPKVWRRCCCCCCVCLFVC